MELGTTKDSSAFLCSHLTTFFSPEDFLTYPMANLPDAIVHFLWKRIENQIVALGFEHLALTVCVSRSSEADSPASFSTHSEP